MSDGRTHSRVSFIAGVLLIPTLSVYRHAFSPAMGLGCALGAILTADLDLSDEYKIHGMSILEKLPAISLLAKLWRWYWWPYGKFFIHRSIASHLPLVGTLIRLVYLFLLPSIVMIYLNSLGGDDILSSARAYMILLWNTLSTQFCRDVFAGLVISDLLHLIYDFNWRTNDYPNRTSNHRGFKR